MSALEKARREAGIELAVQTVMPSECGARIVVRLFREMERLRKAESK